MPRSPSWKLGEGLFFLPGGYRYVKFGGPMREAATSWGWESFQQNAAAVFVPEIGPSAPAQNESALSEPPSLPTSKNAGFDFQIPQEGNRVTLRRLDAPAEVAIHYRSKTYASTVEAIAFLAALFFGIRLIASSRQSQFAFAITVGAGSLVIAGAISPRASGIWTSIYLGVITSIFAWAGLGTWARIKTWLKNRSEPQITTYSIPPVPPIPPNPPTAPASPTTSEE